MYDLAVREKVDLITTACTDQALLTAARVSEKLQLPSYLSSCIAQNITNKAYMKKKFREYGVPTTDWILLEEDKPFLKKIKDSLRYPFLVKPCDANSSKGVVKVNNDKQLEEAVDNAFLLSRSKMVIAENYIEGQEISIDAWKDNEGVKILLVSSTNKMKTDIDKFTIYQSQYPIILSDIVKYKIQDTAEKICKAFELENTPLLIQAIVKGDDISIIECSARMGGGSKYKFIENITGIDIMKLYVNRVLGDKVQCVAPTYVNKSAEMNYVYAHSGILKELIGFEENVISGNISELFQYKTFGSEIRKKTTSGDRVLGFLIEANTSEELSKKRHKILEQVDILDANGDSIMYKECFY
nr:ATP-grasp domain-containing protein [Parablautia muri]